MCYLIIEITKLLGNKSALPVRTLVSLRKCSFLGKHVVSCIGRKKLILVRKALVVSRLQVLKKKLKKNTVGNFEEQQKFFIEQNQWHEVLKK